MQRIGDIIFALDVAKRNVQKLGYTGEVLMLNVIWFVPPAIHSLAQAHTLLNAGGVEVRGTPTTSSDQQFESLLDGSQDAAVTSIDNVILWNRRGRGDDFRVIAQVERTTSISLMARPGFGTIASLAGRRLLVDSAENGFVIALRMLLHKAGVAFGDCTVLPAGGVRERYTALLDGEGDATLLGPPFAGMALDAGMLCLAHADEAFPGFPGQGIVVRTSALERHGAEIAKWLEALEDARAQAVASPQLAIAGLAAHGTPAPLAARLVDAVGPSLVPVRAGIGLLVAQRRELGLPGAEAGYDDIVDTQPLAHALARAV